MRLKSFILLSLLWVFPVSAAELNLSILATNDIHGGVEPSIGRDGKTSGGMALWSGIVSALKTGLAQKHPAGSGVLVVDGGDQFQGTLISNFDEGQLVFGAMNEVGYDAAIPGNHDYDFGPIGWLVDQSENEALRRESLLRLVNQAKFPLLSANTFYKNSMVDKSGKPISVSSKGCRPEKHDSEIDWHHAKRPEFLKTHIVREFAGVRVAIIGIDHPSTPETTTAANVSDLCFGDEQAHYRALRQELEGKADIFVMVIHNGDSNNEKSMTQMVERLAEPKRLVDVVVSGHTHFTYSELIKGVPLIQSGFGGTSFGRVDLVWDTERRRLIAHKTRQIGGIRMFPDACDFKAKSFCVLDTDGKTLLYEGVRVVPDAKILTLIANARDSIRPIASKHLGHAHEELTRDRIKESPLANLMTDLFRKSASSDISMLNTGGLRDNLPAGDFKYEALFKIIPFNNRGLIVGPMPVANLVSLLERSIATCGTYGALMQSGLRVTYKRDCKDAILMGGVDKNARLLRVETLSGQVIYDSANGGLQRNAPPTYTVATLDFLARGGENYEGFKGIVQIRDVGIMRDVLADELSKAPQALSAAIDGRFRNVNE